MSFYPSSLRDEFYSPSSLRSASPLRLRPSLFVDFLTLFLSRNHSNRYAYGLTPCKPIFGICLGNQLMSIAAGGSTYKMRYGNRGMNQPCIDLRTSRCYITPQNHGFAVDPESLKGSGFRQLFLNANDHSNEGIIHEYKPFFSAQFHPEASGGPTDTAFLFEKFINHVNGIQEPLHILDPLRYTQPTYVG